MSNMYDILGKLRLMESQHSAMHKDQPAQALDEKWAGDAKIKPTGQYAGKTIDELQSMLSQLKKSGPHKEGSPGFKKMRQVQFAIRAKRGWKGGVDEAAEPIDELDESQKHAQETSIKKESVNPDTTSDAVKEAEQGRLFNMSLEELLKKHRRDVQQWQQSGEFSDKLYSVLYDYYNKAGEMPYGVAKARTGDPMEWISQQLARDLGMNEGDLDEVSRGEYIRQQDAKAERTGKKKFKAFGQEFSTDEVKENDDMMPDADRGEYDYEGDMAKDQLRTIEAAAEELKSILSDEENLPEWVQKKITLAAEYVDTARDYMLAKRDERGDLALAEKAVSQAQQQAAGIALAAKKAGKTPPGKGAAAQMAKMPKKELEKFAGTKHKGLPKKKAQEEVDETTTSGSVAVTDEAPKSKNKKGMQFGKGIYENQLRESYESRLQSVLAEGVSMNLSVGEDGKKNLTLTATDEDADRLAQMLRLAGLDQHDHGHASTGTCEMCGQAPCGCETVSEGDYGNSPETVTASSDMMVQGLAGGLNGPKLQANPNNPADNALAMPRLGQHASPNLNLGIQKDEAEINEEVERGLRELYKRYQQ